jgi:hypothetical protein
MTINQDTILKLVFRQGSDNDRKHIVFTTGEPAYSTNTRRLYVGNGVLSGGDVVGNLFLGKDATLGSLATNKSPAVIGDIGFVTDTNKLYVLSENDGSLTTDWDLIGGIYTSGDGYININDSNVVTLNQLSANSVSQDLVNGPIILNSGRIGLSATIPFQSVSTKTITISSGLKGSVDGIDITGLPINPLSSNLVIQLSETIPFQAISTKTITVSSGLYSISNGVNNTGTAFNPLSSNFVIGLMPLSAYSASSDFVEGPIIIASGKIGLSANIPFQSVSTKTITVSSGLYATANGVDVTNIAVNSLSSNLVIASNQLYVRYNGLSGATPLYSRGISSSRLSAGHYKFTYGPLNDANIIPIASIIGTNALGYYPRVTNISDTSCDVEILSSNGTKTDANITLLIAY